MTPLALLAGAYRTGAVARGAPQRPGRMEMAADGADAAIAGGFRELPPGWQAEVNGAPQPVLRTNGDFLGCVVGPGKQTVMLEFHPASLRHGWLVSGAGLGLIAVFLVCGLVRLPAAVAGGRRPMSHDPSAERSVPGSRRS